MFSPVEIKRLFHEWQLRFKRMATIASPPSWDSAEWKSFAQALTLRVRDRGSSWQVENRMYWDLRWQIAGGGELICQVEHVPGESTTTIVAQTGGFATGVNSYTWFWAEFDVSGEFTRAPYWVEGTWKDALMSMLMPSHKRAAFMLDGPVATPAALLLQADTSDAQAPVPSAFPVPASPALPEPGAGVPVPAARPAKAGAGSAGSAKAVSR